MPGNDQNGDFEIALFYSLIGECVPFYRDYVGTMDCYVSREVYAGDIGSLIGGFFLCTTL